MGERAAEPCRAAGAGRARGYERHRPEQTVLYQVVAEHWPAFREQAEQAGGLPRFVTEEFDAYLRCGQVEHGGLRLLCERCGHKRVVAFSCKRRGICSSCVGRRMNDVASHLVDHVLPEVPVRQWVCTLPFGLRALCGYDRRLCAAVLGAFVRVVHQSYRRRAKRQLGLSSVHDGHPGSVTFVQRFDSALRLNIHAHTLCLDGVYVQGSDGLEWRELAAPTHEEVLWVAEQSARRVARICEQMGRTFEGPDVDDDALVAEQPVLTSCYAASTSGQGTLRLVGSPSMPSPTRALVAEVCGVNVHAEVAVDGRDRARLERLCRYLARPALAQERLSRLDDGRLCYRLKKAWADGTHAIVLTPEDFIARLVALIPAPRFHMLRYAGVLAPHSTLRRAVVPGRDHESKPTAQLLLFHDARLAELKTVAAHAELDEPTVRGRHRWAWLLRRAFKVDVTVCNHCGGKLRLVEVCTSRWAIERLMRDEAIEPVVHARAPPCLLQLQLAL